MPTQYSKEDLWKIFEKLPKELKDAVFSQETADTIWDTSERNSLGGEQMHQVAILVGDSLIGLLHPEDLSQKFMEEAGLTQEQANNVARDVNRLIMFPVKTFLYDFYKEITFVPSGKVIANNPLMYNQQPQAQRPITSPSNAQSVKDKDQKHPSTIPMPDTYRENIEQ